MRILKTYPLALIVAAIIFSSCDTSTAASTEKKVEPLVKAVSTEKPVFNIPELIGENIEGLKEKLGRPSIENKASKIQAANNVSDDYTFLKEGYELYVTVDPDTKLAVDFYLSKGDSDVKDWKELMVAGNLSENAKKYKIEPVEIKSKPGTYTGIIIK